MERHHWGEENTKLRAHTCAKETLGSWKLTSVAL